jgi:septum formation protein
MKQLILASSSRARKEILENVKASFTVRPSSYEEDMNLDMQPKDLAIFLSRGKARNVANECTNAIVLGADSFAVFDDQLLGKPRTLERATEMLNMLSGRMHSFITGFTIVDADSKKEYSDAVETKVFFKSLTKDDIVGYLAKENVLNNAGAYIIQNLGGVLIEKIEGDYFNVMGLPIAKIAIALRSFNINLL